MEMPKSLCNTHSRASPKRQIISYNSTNPSKGVKQEL